MALAQYCRNETYFNFFRQKVIDKETVILDNGAYEEVMVPPAELARWAWQLRPEVLILPDVPGNFLETLRKSLSYADIYGVPHEGMTVLQAPAGDLDAYVTAYKHCATKWVGFSRLTRDFGMGFSRSRFAGFLKGKALWEHGKVHHALGMHNGNVQELRDLRSQGFYSCDSSSPIWRGLHGFCLPGYEKPQTWPDFAFDPASTEFAPNGLQTAEINLIRVLSACKGDTVTV